MIIVVTTIIVMLFSSVNACNTKGGLLKPSKQNLQLNILWVTLRFREFSPL